MTAKRGRVWTQLWKRDDCCPQKVLTASPILPEMLLPSGVQSDLTRLALGLGKATAAGAESESESRA